MTAWRTATLGDEIELAYGKSLPERSRLGGTVGVYGSNGVVGHHLDACVTGPGIVVGRKGSVGEVVYSSDDFWPIDTTYYVLQKADHNWRFLYHLLRYADLTGLNSHSTIPGLNREDAYKIEVRLPERAVENGLASVLDWIERATQLESDAVARTEGLKAAAMRRLFSRGLRGEAQKETEIGLMPDSWDPVPLGSLGRIGNGSTPKRTNSEFWEGGTLPWLNSAKVYDRDIRDADQFVTDVALRECHLPVLQPGAVLVAITGQGKTLGNAAVLSVKATINQHLAYLQTDLDRAVPKFVRAYLDTQYDYLRSVASGGGSTKGALTCGFLRGMTVPMPPTIVEQQEIVDVLDAVERKIDLHRRKRDVLDQLFKSLLHKLMTGEVSIDDLDLNALPKLEGRAA